jgi:hypothetical protein
MKLKKKLVNVVLLMLVSIAYSQDISADGIWLIHSTENVDEYAKKSFNKKIELHLAKNETESFQVVLMPLSSSKVTVQNSLNKDCLRFSYREIVAVNGYDDVLVPRDSFEGQKGQPLKLWVSYSADEGIPQGNYKDKIVIKGDSYQKEINVSLVIHKVILPKAPSIPAVFGIKEGMFSETLNLQPGDKKTAVMANWAEFMLDYRMDPYFCSWLDDTMQHEAYSSPWPLTDERAVEFLSDERFRRIAMPFYSLGDEQLKRNLTILKETGLLDKSYFYLWDEPTLMEEYAQIRQRADKIHSIEPEADILTTFYCGPKDGPQKDDLFAVFPLWRGAAQIYSMSAWALQGKEENAAKCIASLEDGEEWWTYVCMGPGDPHPNLHLDMKGIQHRAVMWRTWKEAGSGFLYWVVNEFIESDKEDEKISFRKGLPAGDGLLVYPGELFGAEGPLASVRLERWRDGFEDYEYLMLVQNAKGRKAAMDLLKSIYQGPEKYTDNYQLIESFRKKVLSEL